MSSPRIKNKFLRIFKKQINKGLKRVCNDLWRIQFGLKFTGPNQGAECEDCSFFVSGECPGGIPPEKCIEEAGIQLIKERIMDDYYMSKFN